MLKRFLYGIIQWFKGAVFVIKNPRLWKFIIIPMCINFIILSLMFYFAWDNLSDYIPDVNFSKAAENTGFFTGIYLWIKGAIKYVFYMIIEAALFVVVLCISVILYVLLSAIIGSPFYDKLSAVIETLQGFKVEEQSFCIKTSVMYPVINSVKTAMFEVFIIIISFPLNWIPVIGNIFYVLIVSVPLAMGLMGYCTERRLWKFRRLMGFMWKYKYEFSGFGLMSFLSMIPFGLNILTLPLSASGATLLFLSLNKENK